MNIDAPALSDLAWSNATSLAKLGLTADQVAEACEARTSPQTFVASYCETPDGDPMMGLVHQTDYKAEEEWGIGDLRKAITGDDPRRFCMTESAFAHIAVFSDVNAIALSTRPMSTQSPAWGEELVGLPSGYGDDWERKLEFARDTYDIANKWMKMDVLRAKARELGIRPLPRSKTDLVAAIAASPDLQLPERWPAIFSYGKTLVLRADGDGLAARIVAKLADAAMSGTLGIGSSSGPFHSGLFFYDTRDETQQLVEEREAHFDWHDARMAELEPVMTELESRGHRWYFLGKPSENTRDGVTAVRYWLNSHSYPGIGQPSGWYTLQELLDEKFIEDRKADNARREAEKAAR